MSNRVAWLLVACWSLCAGVGIRLMLGYESTPAATQAAVRHWPAHSQLERDLTRPTLLMFVHPRCPCSRASLAELEELASAWREQAAMHVVFVGPDAQNASQDWLSNVSAAGAIAGVRVHYDETSEESRRFGVTASGETLLYAADGELLFHGGLTWARGHRGDNLGREAIEALLQGRTARRQTTAVFGCELTDTRRTIQGAEQHATGANQQP